MTEFYPQIKAVHVVAVLCSGSLFLLRGLLVAAGSRRGNAAPVRYLSYGVDTVLLTAALMLLTILPASMFANGWLALKIVLLVAYVALGSLALKRGPTLAVRNACYLAAMLVYAWMIGIARMHHPLGWLVLLL